MPRVFLPSISLAASLCACAVVPAHALLASISGGCCVFASCPGWLLHGWERWWSLGSVGSWTLSPGQSARCSVHLQASVSSGWAELFGMEKTQLTDKVGKYTLYLEWNHITVWRKTQPCVAVSRIKAFSQPSQLANNWKLKESFLNVSLKHLETHLCLFNVFFVYLVVSLWLSIYLFILCQS